MNVFNAADFLVHRHRHGASADKTAVIGSRERTYRQLSEDVLRPQFASIPPSAEALIMQLRDGRTTPSEHTSTAICKPANRTSAMSLICIVMANMAVIEFHGVVSGRADTLPGRHAQE